MTKSEAVPMMSRRVPRCPVMFRGWSEMDWDASDEDLGETSGATGRGAEGDDLGAKLSATPPSLTRTRWNMREDRKHLFKF